VLSAFEVYLTDACTRHGLWGARHCAGGASDRAGRSRHRRAQRTAARARQRWRRAGVPPTSFGLRTAPNASCWTTIALHRSGGTFDPMRKSDTPSDN
jgi:hypothetical protein